MSRSSSATSLPDDRVGASYPWVEAGKRRVSFTESFDPRDGMGEFPQVKRPRYTSQLHETRGAADFHRMLPPAFYVIREADRSMPGIDARDARDTSSCEFDDGPTANYEVAAPGHGMPHAAARHFFPPAPVRSPFPMEKTLRGLAISDADYDSYVDDEGTLDDDRAAKKVELHLAVYRQRNRNSQHERILKSLICPKFAGAEFEIDDVALQGIFYAANELFFYGKLKGRVTWDWSDHTSSKYQSKIIGTTALRKAANNLGGYETLIVLSHPILKNKRYNRRLLISTFLHELIHSYLFICCGFRARRKGGHTEGFRRIARLIDKWIGPQILYLCNMEADLDDFLNASAAESESGMGQQPSHHVLNSCQMQWPVEDHTTSSDNRIYSVAAPPIPAYHHHHCMSRPALRLS